jgi:hypothetical protein
MVGQMRCKGIFLQVGVEDEGKSSPALTANGVVLVRELMRTHHRLRHCDFAMGLPATFFAQQKCAQRPLIVPEHARLAVAAVAPVRVP